MNLYNRGSAAKPNWWLRYYVDGKEVREPGRGSRKESQAYTAELTRQIKAGTWVHPKHRGGAAGPAAFSTYARQVLTRRIARGVKTAAKDERGHIENHLIPMFGDAALHELTFKSSRTRSRACVLVRMQGARFATYTPRCARS